VLTLRKNFRGIFGEMFKILFCTLCFLLLVPALLSKTKFQQAAPIHLDRAGEKWAQNTLRKLSLEEKIGQVFMIWVRVEFENVNSPEYLQLRENMQKYHIGSFAMSVPYDPPFLHKTQPYEAAMLLNRLQQGSKLPLLVAADFERGVNMRMQGGTSFPHAMAFGAAGKLEYAEAFGRITGSESRAIGVHWNFFPVADVNSNPANPIINTRSFGEDPQQVGELDAAYIRGAHQSGMLTTAKHFPGHGDTATDSHLGLATVTGDMARLNSMELTPFRKAIDAGVDSVMVAHVTVPALDEDPNHVASTSSTIISELLKKRLGFKGIVVTDALDMAGLTNLYKNDIGRAAVDAFKAGSDVLLIPADLSASFEAMTKAVASGEISENRLNESVLKILQTKAAMGLQKARLTDIDKLSELIGNPENVALGQKVAEEAITLVRNTSTILPLKNSRTVQAGLPYQQVTQVGNKCVLIIFSEDMRTASGRTLEREIRRRVPDVNTIYVDSRTADAMSDAVLKAVDEGESVIAAVYMIPTAGKATRAPGGEVKNSVALESGSGSLLHQILEHAASKTVVVAGGNPYLAQDFPAVQTYVCSFSDESISDIAVVKALFGEIPMRGHLPVTIPDIAPLGAGLGK
jgi:beta-N-acetylhexosaminidase